MNLQELIALACRTAESPVTDNKGRLEFVFDDAGLERFAEVVAAAEREALWLYLLPYWSASRRQSHRQAMIDAALNETKSTTKGE